LDFIRALRTLPGQPVISVETFTHAHRPPPQADLEQLFGLVDVFSANLEEARSLFGSGEPEALLKMMLETGSGLATLRLGAEGSLAGERLSGQIEYVPAVATRVVDTLGAGNTYCGAFLVRWLQTRQLRQAAVCGAVAASFMVEQAGLPVLDVGIRQAAMERFEKLY
jgi:ribokinase